MICDLKDLCVYMHELQQIVNSCIAQSRFSSYGMFLILFVPLLLASGFTFVEPVVCVL